MLSDSSDNKEKKWKTKENERMNMKKIAFLVVGLISLGIGVIGVILPILPAFPFFLLCAYCFAKSSERLDRWFRGTSLYKKNLESFTKGEGMPMAAKLRIMATVTLLLGLGVFFMRNIPVMQVVLGVVWLGHIIGFLFIMKTKKEN